MSTPYSIFTTSLVGARAYGSWQIPNGMAYYVIYYDGTYQLKEIKYS